MFRYAVCLLVVFLLLGSCQKAPLKVAFIAPMSGTNSSLGVEGRDGFMVGLEQLDWGHQSLSITWFDDKGKAEDCLVAVDQALSLGIRHFVFQTTSGAGLDAIRRATEAGAFCVSSTISASELSGIKDLFFRTTIANSNFGIMLAEMLHKQYPALTTNICAFGDLSNTKYVQSVYAAMTDRLVALGYKKPELITFDPAKDFSSNTIVASMKSINPESLILCANPINAALLAQNLRKSGQTGQFYLLPWAVNNEFIQNAGKAGEDTYALSLMLLNYTDPEFIDFSQHYRDKTGNAPSYYAQYGYETAWLINQILTESQEREPHKLATFLSTPRQFKGLVRSLQLDEFGDGAAQPFWYQVKDGVFVKL